MTDTKSTLAHINALTSEGIALLDNLYQLLEKELLALKARDIDLIIELNQQKQSVLVAFDQNNRSRAETLLNAQASVDKAGIEFLLEQSDDLRFNQLFRENWNSLEITLQKTMNANQRNEQVLTRSRQSLEQFINALRGQKPANTLYNAKGTKGDYSGQSRIGKA
ncbi:flagellar export chaperone FlgN [Neptunomonas concharum]|uniref:Flagellar protein FlgN n=1 Tax=Neptunomonas concharum TaxID=1031538 RepID=A0A5P1R839_9GAMM|nr:flagellar export chaperone FlgN [Neptunomonas concharum]QEQ95768.1 flagellar protein FlgN [Neptunomonas concharum]